MILKKHCVLAFGLLISVASAQAQVDNLIVPPMTPLPPGPTAQPRTTAADILPVARAPEAAPAPARAENVTPAAPEPAGDPAAWATECLGEGEARACQAIIRVAISGQPALVVGVARGRDGAGLSTQMALPLGFDVRRPVLVEVGGQRSEFLVSRCTAQGCLVEEALPAELSAALVRDGEPGRVQVFSVDGDPIVIALPTQNASAAFAEAGLPTAPAR